MNFADLDLSQSAFLNPRQLFVVRVEIRSQRRVVAYPSPSILRRHSCELRFLQRLERQYCGRCSTAVCFSTAAAAAFGDALDCPTAGQARDGDGRRSRFAVSLFLPSSSRPTVLASAPAFVHTSGVMSPSPPAFGAHVPYPRLQGSSSPPRLMGESDEDLGSESGEGDTAELSDGPDSDFLPNRTSRSRTRSRRTSSVGVSSSSGSGCPTQPCHLSAPVPVPNIAQNCHARRVPTTPVQGGVQKSMRMYKCIVDGCDKSFARDEHLN